MAENQELAKAQFVPIDGNGGDGAAVPVHFNPASLEFTIANSIENKGSGDKKKQYVTSSTGKLTMELIYDTTHNGQDVRVDTQKLATFMQPDLKGKKKTPAIVRFEWGAYKFQGMIENYKETIDFFAPSGVPLRAKVNLTLVNQDKVFEETGGTGAPENVGGSLNAVDSPVPQGDSPTSGSASDVADRAGDPRAARSVAAANNQESLRFPSGAALTVDASVQLGGPVAFASGGVGGGLSAGIGGLDVGGGVDIGAGGSVAVGGAASAGMSAASGAFAQLHTPRPSSTPPSLDAELLAETTGSAALSTDVNASFDLGGQATMGGAIGLSADVGASVSLRDRIQFDW